MKFIKPITILFVSIFFLYSCNTTKNILAEKDFKEQLHILFPDAEISPVKVNDHFTKAYQLVLNSPLDHNNKDLGTFKHYIYVSHSDYKSPTVLVTEGYNARHKTYELSKVLKGNQVMVEYRFYGKSRPNPTPWKHLTNDNAIEDYHAIVTKLKKLYKGKWISTGISKGGETVLIYKSKYPNDVDVAVPYVAPLINTTEDPKTTQHINSVGTKECRDKIIKFQRLLLQNREAVEKEIRAYAKRRNMKFTEVPVSEALEYATLEFSFSFWQWGANCDEIPTETATSKELFNYMNKVVGISFYNDRTFYDLAPSYYQHIAELGYYGFDFTPVKDLLKHVKSTSNRRFLPKNIEVTYNSSYIKKVRDFAENKGHKILYIYGEYDTWGACAPNPKPNVDMLKMVLKKGSHGTRIKHFSKEDQQKIYDKLEKWLKIETYPVTN